MTTTGDRVPGVLHFDVTINTRNEDVTVAMLISHIKKSWDTSKMTKKVFDTGITNRLIGLYMSSKDSSSLSSRYGELGRSDIVLTRIYGAKTELIIDRAQELINFQELSQHSLAPALYCTFNNGYCYKFIEGDVLGLDDISKPEIYSLVAKRMAQIHSVKLSDHFLKNHKMESSLFDTLHRYINLVPKSFPDQVKQKRFEEALPSFDVLHREVDVISKTIHDSKHPPSLTFCHNDLLLGNFIYDEYESEIHVIDHEYGCPNFSAYDIANHFNEWAGVETVDFARCPNKETQLKWLDIYLSEIKRLKGETSPVSSTELENLYVLVSKFELASNLFWGVWGLIQAHYSEIDFGYLEYAILKINEYFKNKEAALALLEINA